MIIGFGSTETQFEENEKKYIRDWVANTLQSQDEKFFDEGFVAGLKELLHARSAEYKANNDVHDNNETDPPARYSKVDYVVMGDSCDLFVGMRFGHTNRRHALSPDGWAYLQTKQALYLRCFDFWD